MADTTLKGSLPNLSKHNRKARRTLSSKKLESSWADSVDNENSKEASHFHQVPQESRTSEGKSNKVTKDGPRSDLGSVGHFMCRLFEEQKYTDVTFYFKETKSYLSAHRVVLAAKCQFFENLLFGKQTKEVVGMEMHIQINNVPLATFTDVVKFFYTDAVEFVDDCTFLDIYNAAKSYKIRRLLEKCKTYINSVELTEDNVCSKLEMAYAHNIDALIRRCCIYIRNNTRRVIRSSDFEKCSFQTVREIAGMEVLSLESEAELLEAVLGWIDSQKVSPQAKADNRRGLFKWVRFLTLTPKQFSEVLQNHPDLVTSEEALQILIYLNNQSADNFHALPKWCSRDRIRRTFRTGSENIPKPLSENGDRRTIQISLKSTREEQSMVTRLLAILRMKCLRETHRIRSIQFRFGSVPMEGCALGIQIAIVPKGPTFLKNHLAKSAESRLTFDKPVTVFQGQTVQVQVTVENRGQVPCEFLQFDNWYSALYDFECFFISEPNTGRLYFISEIEYEPQGRTSA